MNISSLHKFSSLSNKDEISTALKEGKKLKSESGPIYFYKAKNKDGIKFAILVKKNIGRACYRNYIKRIIRFYIRTNATLFENFNRVIFLYNSKKRITDYKVVQKNYDFTLNKK